MDMGKIIEDSFKYPASNWKRLLMFGLIVLIYQLSIEIIMVYTEVSALVLLLLIPFIITYLLILGYQLRAIGTSIRGKMEAPELNNWPKMLLDGLRMFIIGLIYGIIPAIVLSVGFVLLFVGSSSIKIAGAIILLLGVVLLFIMALIMLMAISNMAYHGEVGAALRLSEIKERIKKIGWLNYILIFIILMVFNLMLLLVTGLVSLIPIVGLVLVSLIIGPYMYLFLSRAYGLIYQETLEDEPEEPLSEMENFPGTETNSQ